MHCMQCEQYQVRSLNIYFQFYNNIYSKFFFHDANIGNFKFLSNYSYRLYISHRKQAKTNNNEYIYMGTIHEHFSKRAAKQYH